MSDIFKLKLLILEHENLRKLWKNHISYNRHYDDWIYNENIIDEATVVVIAYECVRKIYNDFFFREKLPQLDYNSCKDLAIILAMSDEKFITDAFNNFIYKNQNP